MKKKIPLCIHLDEKQVRRLSLCYSKFHVFLIIKQTTICINIIDLSDGGGNMTLSVAESQSPLLFLIYVALYFSNIEHYDVVID